MAIDRTAVAKTIFERYHGTHASRSMREEYVYTIMVAIELRARFNEIAIEMMEDHHIDSRNYLIDFDQIKPTPTGWSVVFRSIRNPPDPDIVATTAAADFHVFPQYLDNLLKSYTSVIGYDPATKKSMVKTARRDDFDPAMLFGAAAAIDVIVTFSAKNITDLVSLSTKIKTYAALLGLSYERITSFYGFITGVKDRSVFFTRQAADALESSTIAERVWGQAAAVGGEIIGFVILGLTVWQRFDAKDNPVALATIDANIGLQVVQLVYGGAIIALVMLDFMPAVEFLGPLGLPLAALAVGIPSIVGNIAEWGEVRKIVNHKINQLGGDFVTGYRTPKDDGLIIIGDVVIERIDLQKMNMSIDHSGMFIRGAIEPDGSTTVIVPTDEDLPMYLSWEMSGLFPPRPGDTHWVRNLSTTIQSAATPISAILLSGTPKTHWWPAYEQGNFSPEDVYFLEALKKGNSSFVYTSGGGIKHSLWGLAPTYLNSICTIITPDDRNFSFIVPDVDDLPNVPIVHTALANKGVVNQRTFVAYDFTGNGKSYQIVLSCFNYGKISIRNPVPSGWQIFIKKITHEWRMEGDTRVLHDLRKNVFSNFDNQNITINDQRIQYEGLAHFSGGDLMLVDEMEAGKFMMIIVEFATQKLTPLLGSPNQADLLDSNTASVMTRFLDYCDTTGARRYMRDYSGLTNISGSHEVNYFVDFKTKVSVTTITGGAKNIADHYKDFTELKLHIVPTGALRNYIPFVVESMALLTDTPGLQRFAITGSRALATDSSVTTNPHSRLTYEGILTNVVDRPTTGHDYVTTIEVNSLTISHADTALVAKVKDIFGNADALKALFVLSDDRMRSDNNRIYEKDAPIPIAVPLHFGAALPTINFINSDNVVEKYAVTGGHYAATPEYRWQDQSNCVFVWTDNTISIMIRKDASLVSPYLSMPDFFANRIKTGFPPRAINVVIGISSEVRHLTIDASFYPVDLITFVPDISVLKSGGTLILDVQAGFNEDFYSIDIHGSDYTIACEPTAPAPRLKLVAVVDPAYPQLLTNIMFKLRNMQVGVDPKLTPLNGFHI